MTITTQPGTLGMVNKNVLSVAPEYQRQASPKLIKSIQQAWNWRAAGVLVVNKRNNNHFVIDGQHRLLAAKSIPDIDRLPCIIFDGLSLEEEAAALAEINSNRKSMSAIDKFTAKLIAGDPLAKYVNNRIESYSFRVAPRGANTFNCIKQVMICAAKNKNRFDRVLDISTKLFKFSQVPRYVFVALEYLDSKLSLNDDKLKQRILDVGYAGIVASIKSARIRFDDNSPKTCARGLLEAINKNLRNKFEVEI